MVKEVILIPKDSCPLVFIRELGKKIEDSWFFLHQYVVAHLMLSADESIMSSSKPILIHWNAINELSEISISVQYDAENIWNKMVGIKTDKVCFDIPCKDPKYIYFIKMED